MPSPNIPSDHNLVSTQSQAQRLGYWVAVDEHGYEYIVGAYANKNETGILTASCHTRKWTRDGDKWQAQPFTADEPVRVAWSADGKDLDKGHGRGLVIAQLHDWLAAYMAGRADPIVWLWGDTGRGKDALARCLVADLGAAGVKVVSRSFPATVHTMVESYNVAERKRSWLDEREHLEMVAVLHLEDVGVSKREDVRDLLYLLLDRRMTAGRATICTANLAPQAMAGTDPRISSRVASGVVLELRGPDYRARRV